MIENRSMPPGSVIPELGYEDVGEAADWLCRAFGFRERLRIAEHRIQLHVGDGSIVVSDRAPARSGVMVRVEDADAHHERAAREGARIVSPPTDYPFGERQYTAEDPAGHRWTFSQSIADVDPADWGGTAVDLGNA
jgi:uncharacterized glyoxalase superfamily protein PhnB